MQQIAADCEENMCLESTSCHKTNYDFQAWKFWCRLCAKDDLTNINILLKNEFADNEHNDSKEYSDVATLQPTLADTINKYFFVNIRNEDCLPQMLCTRCYSLATSLTNFMEHVEKVQQMYEDLQLNSSQKEYTSIDYEAIRLKYGLLNAEPEEVLVPQFGQTQFLEAKPKINELEEKILETSIDESEGCEMQNPLAEEEEEEILQEELPRLRTRIKNEAMLEDDKTDNSDSPFPQSDPFDTEEEHDDEEKDRDFSLATGVVEENTSASESEEKKDDCIKQQTERKTKKRCKKVSDDHKNSQNLSNETDMDVVQEPSDSNNKKPRNSKPQEYMTCTECPRKFLRRHHYYIHLKRSHGKEPPPKTKLKCPNCPRMFHSQYNLDTHSRVHLPDELKYVVPCPYCEKKFSSNALVQTHIKYIHNNERPFICEECGIMFRTNVALKSHMLTHTDFAPFECEICKKKFKNHVRLKYHMEIHDPNKHVCSECGLQLNSRATLNRHLLVHSDEMHHKCDYCGRAFKRAKALKNHLILHTGLKPYSCDFCDRTFANGSNCRSHKKKAHPNELAELEAKLKASGGEKQYTKNIPKLEALKAVTKAADNLTPVVSKQSGRFSFGKKPKQVSASEKVPKIQKRVSAPNEEIPPTNSQEHQEEHVNHHTVLPVSEPNSITCALLPAVNNMITVNTCSAIPTIDNIYNHIMKQATLVVQNAQNDAVVELSQHTPSAPPTPTPSIGTNDTVLSPHMVQHLQHNSPQLHIQQQTPLYVHFNKAQNEITQRFLINVQQNSAQNFNGQQKQEEDFATAQSPESHTSSQINEEHSSDVSPARFYNNIRAPQHSAFI